MDLPLIEGCVDCLPSAVAAYKGGADRLELCANLSIGGTTPSRTLFQQVKAACPIPINVLIRPRFGDFLYNDWELSEMSDEIQAFRDLGANGAVIGALTPDGTLDASAMAKLMAAAGDMKVTLHRAFDMARDPYETLERAVELGCHTILTSGQAADALAGVDTLARLLQQANGRIHIMAGSGVRKDNIRTIFAHTGIRVFHTTGRRGPVDSGMVYRKEGVSMGLPSLSEYELWRTNQEEFYACAQLVHSLGQ